MSIILNWIPSERFLSKKLNSRFNSNLIVCLDLKVLIVPNNEWGGNGLLGCDIGYGASHRIAGVGHDHSSHQEHKHDHSEHHDHSSHQDHSEHHDHPEHHGHKHENHDHPERHSDHHDRKHASSADENIRKTSAADIPANSSSK